MEAGQEERGDWCERLDVVEQAQAEFGHAKRQRLSPFAATSFDLSTLPVHLRSRCRLLKPAAASGVVPSTSQSSSSSSFVLYWMRNALRASGNPSLCTAVHASRQLSLPVLVLITVEDGGKHDTARRHTFILEGIRDVVCSLQKRGFATGVYVHSDDSGRALWQYTLSYRAAVVFTDEPFCNPWLDSCVALSRRNFAAPLYAVDSSCVVPCATVAASATSRSGSYERATAAARRATLSAPYIDTPYDGGALQQPAFLFASTPLDDISSLVKRCRLDQSVKPCAHTRGGGAAGNARWAAWVSAGGLKRYGASRNNVFLVGGVSRMSAYLNFGMVSPFRLALEGASSAKFINEMQTWRELAYAYVFHHPSTHKCIAGLPVWAQRDLSTMPSSSAQQQQQRSLEQLAACESGNALWDAMQRSLVDAGELHNNARMTWGKAILQWSASGEDALAKLVYLNDHYALDGQAPPSYGGLLWCLGLFTGGPTIEGRSLSAQAARLDAIKLNERTAVLARFRPVA